MRIITKIFVVLLCMTTGQSVFAQLPLPDYEDRVRIAEAYHLAESVQDSIWTGWSEVPFVILLVTSDFEYLIRHPNPPADFLNLGADPVTGSDIYARQNTGAFSINLLATFPAIEGVNTVVIGQAKNTDKSSTLWAITALHEHFHQLQFTRPWYYDEVENLDLSGGDKTGMWQLNYAFPYDSEAVVDIFSSLTDALTVKEGFALYDPEPYLALMKQLKGQLSDPDYRYFSFQLWQEGVARYTEYAVAKSASENYTPLSKFQALDDFVSYAEALQDLMHKQQVQMDSVNLPEWQRSSFYPVGAAQAMLLDVLNPSWKMDYFSPPFFQLPLK
jgi:hypothetical protein